MSLWLHRFAAQAARNGTTTHTLDWSAGFTPASGSLLVIVIGGSVTHSTPTGWTRIGNAVNATELDVWTKTSDGTETSATTTHNASDYPVGWVIYEFASGSSVAGTVGTSTAATASSWATATSLPGTAVTVFGAGTVGLTGTSDSASLSATSPWLSDVSFSTPASGTDGYGLGVMYQDGVTATSATPVGTLSRTGGVDGERVTFAISVAAGGTNATATPSLVAPPVVTIGTPSVQTGETATPSLVAPPVVTIGTPTITASSTPTPITVQGVVSIPTPTVVVPINATATPALVAGLVSIPRPLVVAGVQWLVWDGQHETQLTLDGEWNGVSIVPLTFDQVTP